MNSANTPPSFRRSPRIVPDAPPQEVVIPAPPPRQGSSSSSLLLSVLPLLLIAGVMVAIGVLSHMSTMIWFSVPMILASGAASVVGYVVQKRKTKSKEKEREQKYRKLLKSYESQLHSIVNKQREIALLNNPPVDTCLSIVRSLNRSLWCRGHLDEDFLSLRLGVGSLPSETKIKAPDPSDPLNPSPLLSEARDLASRYKAIANIPVTLSLRESVGATGIAGTKEERTSFVASLVVYLATHHSPDEVKLVILYSETEKSSWRWTRWLPHVWSDDKEMRFMGEGRKLAHRVLDAIEQVFLERKRKKENSHAPAGAIDLPSFVVIVTDRRLIENELFAQKLLSEGHTLGFYPIVLAERVKALPKECSTWVKIINGKGLTNIVKPDTTIERISFVPDFTDAKTAHEFARLIAPIRLYRASQATIPSMVTLLELFNTTRVEDLNIEARWAKNFRPTLSLKAPIGVKSGGDILYIDLHEKAHGPNGLVAGMVGAGKTELLQTLVTSLAINYHPYIVSFVLVDYKGGGMAYPFMDIPHTLGVITNLQKGHLAERAITSFRVEMERRQKIFKEAGVTHIDQYQALYCSGRVKEPLPYLVIIVDEFAEMKTEQPEIAKEFIRVARLGRSLGFRLILAMQKPAGIVDGQIEANTRFRLCLKVAQTEDSQAMLKRPDAAFLIGRGRAIFQVGANEIFEEFQVGWGGATYDPAASERRSREIVKINIDGSREVLYSPSNSLANEDITQLKAVLAHINAIAKKSSITPLESLWLPPLPSYVPLDKIRPSEGWDGKSWYKADTWVSPVIGLLDDPKSKQQIPLRVNLGKGEHLSVFGAPGYGKTVLLETLITSLSLSYSPSEINLYILDFGGTLLKVFEPLPHVGSVITADEEEKISRLWQFLLREIKIRKEKLGKVGAAKLKEYRNITGIEMPALIVLIDNYPGFYKAYEKYQPQVEQIAREGGGVGVHLVITANSASAVRFHLRSLITSSIALTLADPSEYMDIVGRTDGMIPEAIPGRGLIRKGKSALEVQIAVPANQETDADRTKALRALIDEMRNAWEGSEAPPIQTLPETVLLPDLILSYYSTGSVTQSDRTLSAPLGIRVQDLSIFTVDLSKYAGALLVGRKRGGKTSLIQTWIVALSMLYPPEYIQFTILDSRKKELAPLQRLPHVTFYGFEKEQAEEIVKKLRRETNIPSQKFRIIVVDGVCQHSNNVVSDETQEMLSEMVQNEKVKLLLSGNVENFYSRSVLSSAMMGISVVFLLGHSKDSVVDLNLPYEKRNRILPAGEGYVVEDVNTAHVKFAIADQLDNIFENKPLKRSTRSA